MSNPSLSKAFSTVITNFLNTSKGELSFAEDFAFKRARKKWQEPDERVVTKLSDKCWRDWSSYDQTVLFETEDMFKVFDSNRAFWFAVRQDLSTIKLGSLSGGLSFSAGSTFSITGGRNSMEEKLQNSPWDITHDCFEDFLEMVLSNRCLRVALKMRFKGLLKADPAVRILLPKSLFLGDWLKYCRQTKFHGAHDVSRQEFYSRFTFETVCGSLPANVMRIMLHNVVTYQCGSRFASVPKNNLVRRPINIEPLCNMIVQKRIGSSFREILLKKYGVDLDALADVHRIRISDKNVSTIDLKNASDSISIGLCRWLLPNSVYKKLLSSRSSYISHDGDWFKVNKISAMGNGFTFELMSLILTAIGRQLDSRCSVFGDDIVIHNLVAKDMIQKIESVGFVVNKDKTFVNSPFRESCGGNYHDRFGYIKSFDFLWPVVDHDCVVLFNKVAALEYPCFRDLEQQLRRLIPIALRGPKCSSKTALEYLGASTFIGDDTNPFLDSYFRSEDMVVMRDSPAILEQVFRDYSYGSKCFIFTGYTSKVEEVNRQLHVLKPSFDFGKLFMYLHANGRTRNVLSWSTSWTHCKFVYTGGRVFRLKNLLQQHYKSIQPEQKTGED